MRDAAWGSAAGVTRHASTQSYLTIRTLADRAYRHDAFALYAYFRWLDDQVDEALGTVAERVALVECQRRLMAGAGPSPATVAPPERLLVGLLRRPDGEPRADAAGARLAVASMLDVMAFDATRRGRCVTGTELDGYTHTLAVAVTEALHHCIGHGAGSAHDASRYVAVTGAHIAHMLRDLRQDVAVGYLNVPAEVLAAGVAPDEDSTALRPPSTSMRRTLGSSRRVPRMAWRAACAGLRPANAARTQGSPGPSFPAISSRAWVSIASSKSL